MLTRPGIRVGKLFGIQIQLDWSLIVIFLLVALSLGASAFPAWHPDWSAPLTWGVALAAAVLFFVSILLHELSHALVAKHYGIPVDQITLFLFGGIANIEHDPDSPKKEALMAAIGPLTSIALGVGFTLLAGLLISARIDDASDPMLMVRQMGPLTTLLSWLGPVNVLLGLFNMLPGFPLDGGRVLRATLWAATRDLKKATRWATRVGQTFGWALIAIGFSMLFGFHFPVLGGGLVNGLWLAFIGWFLGNAASASYQQLLVREALEGVTVARLMRRGFPPVVPASTRVRALVDHWLSVSDDPFFAVSNELGEITGFVSPSDVRRLPREQWQRLTLDEIAGDPREIPTVRPDEKVFAALGRLGREAADALLVSDGAQILGILRRDDVARWLSLAVDTGTRPGIGRAAGART